MELLLLLTIVVCFLLLAMFGGGVSFNEPKTEQKSQETEWQSGAIVRGIKGASSFLSSMHSDAQNKVNKK